MADHPDASTPDPSPLANDDAPPIPEPPAPHVNPITGAERIEALDVLRGLAVLGIFVMNVQSFGALSAAYMNPALDGLPTGSDLWIWAGSHLLADTKFMSLFSFMFGVGIAVFADRLAARGRKPAGLHYRRMGWLWLIGMLHGYLLWYGDILVSYAVCGMVVYLLRNLRARWLVLIGVVMIAVPSLGILGFSAVLPKLPPEALEGMAKGWSPPAAEITKELEAMRGNWLEQMPVRAKATIMMQTFVHLFFVAWRSGGLMLIGMAALKSGVITLGRSTRYYATMLLLGAGLGLPLIAWGMVRNFEMGFAGEYSMLQGMQFNYWGGMGVAAAYLAIVMLTVKARALPAVRVRLAATGRMAFSNYLGQTLIATTIFYGHGFGLYAQTERWQQLLIVLGVWALQLIISPWWLQRYRFGPMEWVWRSLTYWERQPMRREER